MKISVILPTYKPQAYLWECLDSFMNQTFPMTEFEVLIILNGCCEPYHSNIDQYIRQKQAQNIHLIQTDIPGVSNARNIGLDHAQGEYITFMDDDDYVSSSYLAELYAKATPEIISLSNYITFYDDTKEQIFYGLTFEFQNKSTIETLPFYKVRKYFSGPTAKLIHKNIIDNRRFDKQFKVGEDSLFMFTISNRIKQVSFTSSQAIYYRRLRTGSVTMSSKGGFIQRWYNAFLLIKKYCVIFLKGPNYSYKFFTTRILGAIHSALNAKHPGYNKIQQ